MSSPLKTLIIEDSEEDCLLITRFLRKHGFNLDIHRIETKEALRDMLDRDSWDLILCDYTLPRMNARDALACYRENNLDIPFIVVSGTIGEEVAVEMMVSGAHDYVMKNRLNRLAPAIERELRETQMRRERCEAQKALLLSHEKTNETLIGAIKLLSRVSEIRDPYTAGHQKRVALLAAAIGRKLNFSKNSLEALHFAAMIHDIGKISVPTEILVKPSTLSASEFGLIKTHPLVGFELLKDIEFPWPLATIIHQHHERLNGSGYPQGLNDGEIISEAKIIAVADTVEAMMSHRPYRPAIGLHAALDEIERNAGALYDISAVSACIGLFRNKQFSFETDYFNKDNLIM
ncbi:MAG: HD domain-containing protein [Deltaproteobacteria bacterium]|nr:HD domain-containing protein [Deltaproteobacteria bacterium]